MLGSSPNHTQNSLTISKQARTKYRNKSWTETRVCRHTSNPPRLKLIFRTFRCVSFMAREQTMRKSSPKLWRIHLRSTCGLIAERRFDVGAARRHGVNGREFWPPCHYFYNLEVCMAHWSCKANQKVVFSEPLKHTFLARYQDSQNPLTMRSR